MSTGDNGFVLICAAFVFFMTPGLAFFYVGLVRRKNIVNTIMACVDVPCAIVQLGRLGAPPVKNSDMVTDSINCHLLRRT